MIPAQPQETPLIRRHGGIGPPTKGHSQDLSLCHLPSDQRLVPPVPWEPVLLKNVPKITGEIVRNLCHQLRVAAQELPNWVAGANTEVDPKVAKTVRYGIVALMNDGTIVGPSFNIPGVGVGGGIEANICAEMGLTAKLTALKLREVCQI